MSADAAELAVPVVDVEFATVTADDMPEIVSLHATVFGPGRFARTAFRVREMAPPDVERSLLARRRGELVGAVLQSPVAIGEEPGAWLGPIAVTADGRRAGVGAALMARAIARDAESGDRFVMLIGDESYYGRFGFKVVASGSIQIPGPADPKRLLAVSLTPLPILPVGAVQRR